MMLAPHDRYSSDSALVENSGPSITTQVPPECVVMPRPSAVLATRPLKSGQNGSANPTWATIPSPKKVLTRLLVRSISWSGTTMSSGATSSLRLPTALIETMRSTPRDLRA